jgi:hypothetical protein
MIFSQGGGGGSTPYEHPVAMYARSYRMDLFFWSISCQI